MRRLRRRHPDGEHRDDQLLKRRAPVVEGEIAARLEDADACREHEVEVGGVAERRRRDAHASRWRGAAAADPAAPVQLHLLPAGGVHPHRLVPIGREEEVAVVGRDDRVLDPGGRELADRPGEVVDDRVHDLPRLEREARLAGLVDLLRADDDERRALDLLRQLRRLEAQQLVEARGRPAPARARQAASFVPPGPGRKAVVDAGAELPALLDHAEARRGPGHAARPCRSA